MVTLEVLGTLNDGDDITVIINSTIVILIPKTKNSITMSDFRPISLCIVLYKIGAKTLVN